MVAILLFLAITISPFQATRAQGPTSGPVGSASGPSAGLAPGPSAGLAPGPSGPDCMTLLLGMADCLSYVQIGSNLTKPDKPCCPELKSLVDTNPICLCELLANSDSSGFQIDINRATKLPSVCKVDTPPPSTCALLGIPVGVPTSSEGPSPSSGLSPAGSSTALSPGKNSGNRASSATTASIVAVLVGGFAITFSSTIFF
ncbi:Bifunctional inhibitor/plant lipid transfer protein/seed storage helical domain containing protein [Trema orientale]|uniref:Bifunctional inhibitor/plant lipid transfer protein/seed storage helical domain containing protein n=1 Tax=Trema orientale TaxID=63057 RepID=A0A2P5FUG5_TREOI|nr:Bifunctional inhibitor/plant lipid transfer protein/seed storage helical domain containing protein [Trema orientale]